MIRFAAAVGFVGLNLGSVNTAMPKNGVKFDSCLPSKKMKPEADYQIWEKIG